MVMMPDPGPTHAAAEKLFRRISASAVYRISLFVVDALYLKTSCNVFHDGASSALRRVPLAMRFVMTKWSDLRI
jgi:hypothetical protein